MPSVLAPAFVEPSAPAPLAPPSPGHAQLVLAYAADNRDEVTRLIAAARAGG
ncbi:hypothetical protein ACIRRH_34950 [Kitasatospora sp. NPDC101235]|uniref:hypothetical protein n=1 Tax=Kitasatospora sp. NPDC101235 TaxID=3364101 RepID=UPI00381941BD